MASAAVADPDKTLDDHLQDALTALAAIDLRTITKPSARACVKDARDLIKKAKREAK